MKQKIRFIINPISGVGKKGNIPSLIEECLDFNVFEFDSDKNYKNSRCSQGLIAKGMEWYAVML